MKLRAVLTVLLVVGLALTSCEDPATTTTGASSTSSDGSTITTTSVTLTSEATTTTATGAATNTTIEGIFVSVFFSVGDGTDCAEVAAFDREISATVDPIQGALEQLTGGPTAAEEAAGAGSFFSEASAGSLPRLDLVDGHLTVVFDDFRALLNNASTSCGSEAFLSSLNATVFQFDDVEQVRYTIQESCGVFYGWLQRDCQDQTRTGPVTVDIDTNDSASGSGCTPDGAVLTDGEWFGYVEAASDSSLEFDLACWFSGAAAEDAAAADGNPPPDNDYYIRNESNTLRTVPVSGAAVVEELVNSGGPDLSVVVYDSWSAGWASLDYHPGVWLTIKDGEVVHIVEQYVP